MISPNQKIALISQFGSHVYGTNVPSSDFDYKGIYLPSKEQILLQNIPETFRSGTKTDPTAKNQAGDIDNEFFSLQKYLKLLCDGQTPCLDLLFTPSSFYQEKPLPIWNVIQENKQRFLHKGIASFTGYVKQQADKYGIKGSYIAALKLVIDFMSQFQDYRRLNDAVVLKKLFEFVYVDPYTPGKGFAHEHIELIDYPGPQKKMELVLSVRGKIYQLQNTVKYVIDRMQYQLDNYGQRAMQAHENKNVDAKACMHAVRIGREAEELLLTGNITFPRPERELLLKIRKSEIAYSVVADYIEDGLEKVRAAQLKSTLPEQPDREFARQLILETHEDIILGKI